MSFQRALGAAALLASLGWFLGCSGEAEEPEPAARSNSSGKGGKGGSSGKGGKGGASGKGGSEAGGEGGQTPGGSGPGGAGPGGAGSGPGGAGGCSAGTIDCDGSTMRVCDGKGGYSETKACPQACALGLGCVTCVPGTGSCNGQTASRCKPDGSGFTTVDCDPDLGLTCQEGACQGSCAPESLLRSYIGCEYFPTVTSNGEVWKGFHYAVAVANTTQQPASVKVTQGAQVKATVQVPPGSLQTIQLPWVPGLDNDYVGLSPAQIDSVQQSSLVKQGAYRLTSTQPVTVYQFNPLEFQLSPPPAGCPYVQDTGACNSYSNDASLLLPVTSLGTEYVVGSWKTLAGSDADGVYQTPGFVSVTAVQDGTTVTFTPAGTVRAGQGVPELAPGQQQTFSLDRGDVLQLLSARVAQSQAFGCVQLQDAQVCNVPAEADLSGSVVTSDKPVQVLGGHSCTFLPYSKYACDHLEESIFPVNTLGNEVIITAPQSVTGAASGNGAPDPQYIRVISVEDGNMVTLDPPLFPGGVINRGKYADVVLSDQDLIIKGTGKLLVFQYMMGGDQVDPANSGTTNSKGDPSMSIGIPSSQYRNNYIFLAPETYTYNFVNIIAPKGATVKLDGAPVSGNFSPIGSSNYAVLRKAIPGGVHSMESDTPFGIVVHGYGSYTSYMYPGGLNLGVQ